MMKLIVTSDKVSKLVSELHFQLLSISRSTVLKVERERERERDHLVVIDIVWQSSSLQVTLWS